jgi:hypothetical protein
MRTMHATVSACTRSNVCERRVRSLLRTPSKSPPSVEEIVVRAQPTIARAEQVGTRPSFRLGTTRMVVGRSGSWTPRRNYENMAIHIHGGLFISQLRRSPDLPLALHHPACLIFRRRCRGRLDGGGDALPGSSGAGAASCARTRRPFHSPTVAVD